MASLGGKRKRNDNEDARDLTIDGINTIFVKTYTGETFSLQVKGSDTIISVKFKIQDKIYYLSPDEQALIFDDMVLEDLITLADYRVKKNSTLTLMRNSCGLVPIFIIDLKRKRRWPVNVSLSDTVRALKKQISYLLYPHEERDQVIVFNDIVLNDYCKLADFNIKADSVLTLKLKTTLRTMKSKTWKIFVKTLAGKAISQDVIATTTIGEVKTAIRWEVRIPEDEQVFIFNEMVLDDSRNIFDFGIKNGSTLTLMRVSKGVEIDNGKSRSFEVKPSDTIEDLKNQISDEVMQIFVNTVTGISTSIEVKPSVTIGNLKKQISDRVGIPVEKQVLVFNEMVLHDTGILADFHIKTKSTLTLIRKSRGPMQIFIHHDVYGSISKVSLEINPLHTIAYLKARLCEEGNLPCITGELQVLFNRRWLEDRHTCADYNIQKDDVIRVVQPRGGWRWGDGLEI